MRLTVQALDKSYSTQVLRNVNLQVGPGEIHAIVGENGAGKTTLLNILSGNTMPDRGTMTLDGSPYTPANAQRAYRAGLSLCSQELGLIDNLSVAENIGLRALPGRLLLDRASLRRRCLSAVEISAVGLSGPPPLSVLLSGRAGRVGSRCGRVMNLTLRTEGPGGTGN